MFTGIVEEIAEVTAIEQEKANTHFYLKSKFLPELKIDQSIAHNGTCLTVTKLNEDSYSVTAIEETLQRTNLGTLKVGDKVNLERCMRLSDRLDGHLVQGHVDQVGELTKIEDQNGSYKLYFNYKQKEFVTVEKGSICVNGISLTVVDSEPGMFSVAIIPYTWDNTNLSFLKVGDLVNLEFDILGKYVQKLIAK
ncbi:riboflavin synthase [Weeksellaceae bacterium TAE3-ERU29]|nr:riboflavin synthase [Weeksellaceae bacterium TAE3-ERU29]